MKKLSLFTGLISVCLFNAQIKFEKGYFINNSGEKTEVLIKNIDWKNNPTEFDYKTEGSSEVKKENIKNIQEFAIENSVRYIRKTVMMDHSSEDINFLSNNKEPKFEQNEVFLKYLVDGKVNLLYYENGNLKRFFYNSDNVTPKQLIFKAYYLEENLVGYNEEYKNQLSENLKCGIYDNKIHEIKYNKKKLSEFFINYNECSTGKSINYNPKKKDLLHLNIRPGINFSNLNTSNTYNSGSTDTKFNSKITFRIGAEIEFTLPFNKNKWALFIEPTYQYYKSEAEKIEHTGNISDHLSPLSVDYKSLELPLGIRHYFFLNEKSKIFLNAAYIIDFKMKSSIKTEYSELEILSGNNFALGVGYKYNNKFISELRIQTSKNLLQGYNYWESNYNTVSIILGYTLF